ncbi:hypothetical protein [Paenibacillus amylolyticus]|uniref:hypothetical protein n=1 Tax=Paenibacillus amylolyticus TaxID=1451 RepID=UPI003EB6B116
MMWLSEIWKAGLEGHSGRSWVAGPWCSPCPPISSIPRFWRWKSDAKLALTAPSSLSLLVPLRAGCSRYSRSLAHIGLRAFRLAR